MEQNPLEQQKIKIDSLREEMRGNLGRFFDDKGEMNNRINAFVLQLENLEKAGLVFNKEEIVKGVRESIWIEDREKFITRLIEILEPLTILRATQSKIFEKIERDETINSSGNLRLGEVLYVGFENETANLHLAPAAELIKDKGIANFKQEIESGLSELARIMQGDENIKEVWATSWIVAKNKLLLEKLGFTFVGEISEMENDTNYVDRHGNKRPFASAFMKREDFLARYGSK
jgi:hypothetical protein